jgi:IS5 family transposase
LTYVSIFKRIRKIDVKKLMDEISKSNINKEDMYIIIDSTGFKITDRGEWINNKYNKKRKGWIKVHLAIDAKSFNIVSLSITDEKVHDSKEFKKVMDPVVKKTKVVYADKGYDSKEIYNYLSNNGNRSSDSTEEECDNKGKRESSKGKISKGDKEDWRRRMEKGSELW